MEELSIKIHDLLSDLNIDEEKINIDSLLLSLTHKNAIVVKDKEDLLLRLNYLDTTGETIYKILLKEYIFSEVNQSAAVINKGFTASKTLFLDRFINKTQISELFIVEEKILNEKILHNLTYQFIGFLFISGFYDKLETYFLKVFDKKDINVFDDFLGIIKSYADVNNFSLIINEKGVSGSSHSPIYYYEIICNGKAVESEGKSKKESKNNCAKIFCENHLDYKDLLRYSGIKKPKIGNGRFILDSKRKLILENFAQKIGLNFEDVFLSFRHASLSNRFAVTNNSAIASIGADIERLYIFRKCSSVYDRDIQRNMLQVVSYIHENRKIYYNFLKEENIACLLTEPGYNKTESSIISDNEDTFRSLLYFVFKKNKSLELKPELDVVYDRLISKVDLRYIHPVNKLAELFGRYNIQIKYNDKFYDKLFTCEVVISTTNTIIQFQGQGSSKKISRQLAATEALKWYFNHVEPFLIGDSSDKIDLSFVNELLDTVVSTSNKDFYKDILNNNYFGITDAINGNSDNFIKRIGKTFQSIEKKDKLFNFVEYLSNLPQIFMKNLGQLDLLIETIIFDIADSIRSGDSNSTYTTYSINYNLEALNLKNELLIKKYISENGLLIKNIINPTQELQMIAIKNNPASIHYIQSPSNEVIKYLIENTKSLHELKKINNISNEILVEIMTRKYNNLLIEKQFSTIPTIVSNQVSFDIHLRAFFKLGTVRKFNVATGFFYSSGIELLRNEISELVTNNAEFKLIVGSLQGYNNGIDIKNMDQKTAQILNELTKHGAKLRTFAEKFYHGKVYYIEYDHFKIIIIGSTNFSKNAFRNNKEIDCMFFFSKEDDNEVTSVFDGLWSDAEALPHLEVARFTKDIVNYIDINYEELLVMSKEDLNNRIKMIPDKELRDRLNLWIKFQPSNFYDDIIVAGQSYIAIEYRHYDIVVLESFYHGNSYFVFYGLTIRDVLKLIENKTKSEIFEMSGMKKRGYHIKESLKLELQIKSYFLGRKNQLL